MKTIANSRTPWLIASAAIVTATALGSAFAYQPASPQDGQGKPPTSRTSTDAPIPAQGKLGQDLFIAIGRGDVARLQSLLKEGADPDARNGLMITPLYLASATAQTDAIEALLKAGAKLDAPSPYGTPLVFGAMSGAVPSMNLLISKGANVNAARADGVSVLIFASRAGAAGVVSDLLRRKADVNGKDNDGATPLIYAVREGKMDVGRILLSGGASVDLADSHGRTPLMYAAISGSADFVQLLTEHGVKPNLRDKTGRTALMLTAMYCANPEATRALIKAGADRRMKDSSGKTALALAAARGHADCAMLLGDSSFKLAAQTRTAKQAVQISLEALSHSMLEFNHRTGCISCHQEGLGRMVTADASDHGFTVDPAVDRSQVERINGALHALCPLHLQALKDPETMKQVPLIEINEVTTGYSFILAGMAAHKQPATEEAGAMAMVLARQQQPGGEWNYSLPRIPMQSSFFTFTALTIRSLRTYAPQAYAAEVADRVAKAKAWLMSAAPMSNEDRTFRLLGLAWAGATGQEMRKMTDELRAQQQPDGGWRQEAGMQSDAYATGEALYALNVCGSLPVSGPEFQKGVQFLLRTQDSDGSWFVNKRAMPANNYFDAGFPHGESQFSSFNGTCWAVMALMQTIDRKNAIAAR